MKKHCVILLSLVFAFLISACEAPFALPRATEPRGTAIVSVLGVEKKGDVVEMYSASQSPGEEESRLYESGGNSFAAAMLDSRDEGLENVSYAHVEHVILGEDSEKSLGELLSFCLENGEQSMKAKLWVLDGISLEKALGGEMDCIGRLNTLRVSGEAGTSLGTKSLGETAVKLAKDGCVLLPMLGEQEGALVFAGYAIFENGAIVGELVGEKALYGGIVGSDELYWVENARTVEGKIMPVQLYSEKISFVPSFEEGRLEALDVCWSVEGKCTEDVGGTVMREDLQRILEKKMGKSLRGFQLLGLDPVGICEKTGLRRPWCWDKMKNQWEESFPSLAMRVTVNLNLDKGA